MENYWYVYDITGQFRCIFCVLKWAWVGVLQRCQITLCIWECGFFCLHMHLFISPIAWGCRDGVKGKNSTNRCLLYFCTTLYVSVVTGDDNEKSISDCVFSCVHCSAEHRLPCRCIIHPPRNPVHEGLSVCKITHFLSYSPHCSIESMWLIQLPAQNKMYSPIFP